MITGSNVSRTIPAIPLPLGTFNSVKESPLVPFATLNTRHLRFDHIKEGNNLPY